jgi:Zn-dependent protease with chaperone function
LQATFLFWGFLFLLLRKTIPPEAHFQPGTLAVIFLFFLLVSFAFSPLQSFISRDMEEDADRVSVQLTGNVPAVVRLQTDLPLETFPMYPRRNLYGGSATATRPRRPGLTACSRPDNSRPVKKRQTFFIMPVLWYYKITS